MRPTWADLRLYENGDYWKVNWDGISKLYEWSKAMAPYIIHDSIIKVRAEFEIVEPEIVGYLCMADEWQYRSWRRRYDMAYHWSLGRRWSATVTSSLISNAVLIWYGEILILRPSSAYFGRPAELSIREAIWRRQGRRRNAKLAFMPVNEAKLRRRRQMRI